MPSQKSHRRSLGYIKSGKTTRPKTVNPGWTKSCLEVVRPSRTEMVNIENMDYYQWVFSGIVERNGDLAYCNGNIDCSYTEDRASC